MLDAIIVILMFSGSFFALVASIGLLRMPDLFTRIQTATKAITSLRPRRLNERCGVKVAANSGRA